MAERAEDKQAAADLRQAQIALEKGRVEEAREYTARARAARTGTSKSR